MATNSKDGGDENENTEPEVDERERLGPAERRCGISLEEPAEDTG